MALNFISWNLEKRRQLVMGALTDTPQFKNNVDVALFQEYDTESERPRGYQICESVSFKTYGTAVYSRLPVVDFETVSSPHWDHRLNVFSGTHVYKMTTIATLDHGGKKLTVVSFHGFNGTRPLTPWKMRRPEMLLHHVQAVLAELPKTGPCVFAGDFNTWTSVHHQVVNDAMAKEGFKRVLAVPYEDSDPDKFLDLVYVRKCKVSFPHSPYGRNKSDHPYMLFTVTPE